MRLDSKTLNSLNHNLGLLISDMEHKQIKGAFEPLGKA
jgi:hypothetical protein